MFKVFELAIFVDLIAASMQESTDADVSHLLHSHVDLILDTRSRC